MRIVNEILFKKNWNYVNVFLILFFSQVLISQSNTKYNWAQVPTPYYSNINHLFIFSDSSGIAAGKILIIYKDSIWTKFLHPAPKEINKLFAIDTNSIFITHNNKFQESDLYYWNGDNWKQIYHPLANSIISMSFTDQYNGLISGYGEIAILKDSIWNFIPSPVNDVLFQLVRQSDSCIWTTSISGVLYKYDNNWSEINSPFKIYSIQLYNNELYVIGEKILGKIVGDSIEIISQNDKLNNQTIISFSIVSPDDIIVVGVNGSILHYINGEWIDEKSNTNSNLNSISRSGANFGWIVGDDGLILQYTNSDSTMKIDSWKGFEKTNVFRSIVSKVVDDEYGVVVADFSGDGLTDIFTCGLYEENHLYINKGEMLFIDEANKRGIEKTTDKSLQNLNLGACAVDWDNDGDMDIYLGILNGENKLYENMGGENFVEYSSISNGFGDLGDRTNACIFGDVDNDGDLDLFITNEHSSNRLYQNNGAGIFKEITESVGLRSIQGGMSCSFGDIDNDGDLDLYVANWSGENIMYKNLFIETGEIRFIDISLESKTGGDFYTKSNAVVFADIDNDADLDLYVTNRKTSNRLYINDGKGVFIDKTENLLGLDSMKSNGVLIADFDGNGWKDIYISNVGENAYYDNKNGEFIKKETNIDGYSTGSAYADFDNDGDLDMYIANYVGESSVLLINKLNTNKYIKVQIEGVINNRSGIGSKIFIYKDKGLESASELIDFRQITAGSGYASMNELTQTIQIQNNNFVDIKIVFPSGLTKSIEHVKTGSKLLISDVTGIKKQMFLIKNFMLRRLLDPHELYELIKWLFILLFISYSTIHGFRRYDWSLSFAVAIVIGLFVVYFLQYYYLEYNNFFFSTLLPFVSVIGLVLLLLQFFEQKYTKQLAAIEQERIRGKLSRDLHDDLASTISSIGIYLTLIRYNITDKNVKLHEFLEKSESLVSDATSSITDLIWAIKPKPESLTNLIIRINNNFAELFRENNINYVTITSLSEDSMILTPKVKQNVYLLIKEALNNILKYAKAENVLIEVKKISTKVQIIIKDDGIGFDFDKVKGKGHGLNNMQRRATDIGADFKVTSKISEGTKCELVIKI